MATLAKRGNSLYFDRHLVYLEVEPGTENRFWVGSHFFEEEEVHVHLASPPEDGFFKAINETLISRRK